MLAFVDEGRKRVLLVAAAILAAWKVFQYSPRSGSPSKPSSRENLVNLFPGQRNIRAIRECG